MFTAYIYVIATEEIQKKSTVHHGGNRLIKMVFSYDRVIFNS